MSDFTGQGYGRSIVLSHGKGATQCRFARQAMSGFQLVWQSRELLQLQFFWWQSLRKGLLYNESFRP
jgi:hypothetical protein